MMPSFSGLIGFPRTPSIMFKTIFPPSKAGIGNKLIIPKFIDNMAIKNTTVLTPALDASSDNLNIMTGPPSLFKLKPVNSEPSALKICVVLFKVS